MDTTHTEIPEKLQRAVLEYDKKGTADAMQQATPIIEQEMRREGLSRESLGIVVVGSVLGDIHTIGKTMVATLLTAKGFTVHDLAVYIKAGEFAEPERHSEGNGRGRCHNAGICRQYWSRWVCPPLHRERRS